MEKAMCLCYQFPNREQAICFEVAVNVHYKSRDMAPPVIDEEELHFNRITVHCFSDPQRNIYLAEILALLATPFQGYILR